jgi:hypothetical protein
MLISHHRTTLNVTDRSEITAHAEQNLFCLGLEFMRTAKLRIPGSSGAS